MKSKKINLIEKKEHIKTTINVKKIKKKPFLNSLILLVIISSITIGSLTLIFLNNSEINNNNINTSNWNGNDNNNWNQYYDKNCPQHQKFNLANYQKNLDNQITLSNSNLVPAITVNNLLTTIDEFLQNNKINIPPNFFINLPFNPTVKILINGIIPAQASDKLPIPSFNAQPLSNSITFQVAPNSINYGLFPNDLTFNFATINKSEPELNDISNVQIAINKQNIPMANTKTGTAVEVKAKLDSIIKTTFKAAVTKNFPHLFRPITNDDFNIDWQSVLDNQDYSTVVNKKFTINAAQNSKLISGAINFTINIIGTTTQKDFKQFENYLNTNKAITKPTITVKNNNNVSKSELENLIFPIISNAISSFGNLTWNQNFILNSDYTINTNAKDSDNYVNAKTITATLTGKNTANLNANSIEIIINVTAENEKKDLNELKQELQNDSTITNQNIAVSDDSKVIKTDLENIIFQPLKTTITKLGQKYWNENIVFNTDYTISSTAKDSDNYVNTKTITLTITGQNQLKNNSITLNVEVKAHNQNPNTLSFNGHKENLSPVKIALNNNYMDINNDEVETINTLFGDAINDCKNFPTIEKIKLNLNIKFLISGQAFAINSADYNLDPSILQNITSLQLHTICQLQQDRSWLIQKVAFVIKYKNKDTTNNLEFDTKELETGMLFEPHVDITISNITTTISITSNR